MKIEAIVNNSSGPKHEADLEQRVREAFEVAGANARVHIVDNGAELTTRAKQAIASDAEVIVAGGGDGTISTVASLVVDSNKTFGVLPLGTMNHFAKDLQIPLELEAAVETIVNGQVTLIDVGEVNKEVFINNSSLGLYPQIVREREKQQRLGWSKGPAFVWAALTTLRRYPFLDIRISVDGAQTTKRTPFVFIGNNEYQMETLNIGSRACLDKGELSLYMANRMGRLGLIRLALNAILGRLRQDKDFIALCTNEIWIGTRHSQVRVALDGETKLLQPPLHYRIHPKALRVMIPSDQRSVVSGQR